jgi:hypothetical protein
MLMLSSSTAQVAQPRRVDERARGGTVSTVVGLENIPEALCSLHTLASPDYADLSTATTNGTAEKSAEQWARAILEDAPLARRYAFFPWRVLLGLRLGPRHSPDHVHGWKIADRGENWLRIEAASWFLTAHGVFRVDDGQVSVAWFGGYDRLPAALVWPPLSLGHRRAMRAILRQALRTQQPSR